MYGGLIRDVMKEWKKEARVKYIVLYRLKRERNDYNDAEYKLVLCTNHPGPFIGLCGSLVAKYQDRLSEVLRKKVFIEFVETTDVI